MGKPFDVCVCEYNAWLAVHAWLPLVIVKKEYCGINGSSIKQSVTVIAQIAYLPLRHSNDAQFPPSTPVDSIEKGFLFIQHRDVTRPPVARNKKIPSHNIDDMQQTIETRLISIRIVQHDCFRFVWFSLRITVHGLRRSSANQHNNDANNNTRFCRI